MYKLFKCPFVTAIECKPKKKDLELKKISELHRSKHLYGLNSK